MMNREKVRDQRPPYDIIHVLMSECSHLASDKCAVTFAWSPKTSDPYSTKGFWWGSNSAPPVCLHTRSYENQEILARQLCSAKCHSYICRYHVFERFSYPSHRQLAIQRPLLDLENSRTRFTEEETQRKACKTISV